MTERTYPYTAWTLTPSFKPVEIVLVKPYSAWSREDYGDRTEAGKFYATNDLHPTEAVAIAVGRSRLIAQQAKIDKMQAMLHKRRAALDKAEASK